LLNDNNSWFSKTIQSDKSVFLPENAAISGKNIKKANDWIKTESI